MSYETRLDRIAAGTNPSHDTGIGSPVATIGSWIAWWCQPMNKARLTDDFIDACYRGWEDRFGQSTTRRAWDGLISGTIRYGPLSDG